MLNTTTNQISAANYSMAGVIYLPLPLGSIRIGHSQRMPDGSVQLIKDDEFKITLPLRDGEGNWARDAVDAKLREALPGELGASQRKLREIPVTVLVNDPALIARSRLEAFDTATGRVMCTSEGNGVAKRWSPGSGTSDVQCLGCERCPFANSGSVACKLFGRINVQVVGQADELGTYTLRSTSYNTLRTVESKLWQYWSLFGGKLRGVPFKLTLRPVQTQASDWETFYVVDLVLNDCSLEDAKKKAEAQFKVDTDANLGYSELASAMTKGLKNGGFHAGDFHDGFDPSEFVEAAAYSSSVRTASALAGKSQPLGTASVSKVDDHPGLVDATAKDPVSAVTSTLVIDPANGTSTGTGVFLKGLVLGLPKAAATTKQAVSVEPVPVQPQHNVNPAHIAGLASTDF